MVAEVLGCADYTVAKQKLGHLAVTGELSTVVPAFEILFKPVATEFLAWLQERTSSRITYVRDLFGYMCSHLTTCTLSSYPSTAMVDREAIYPRISVRGVCALLCIGILFISPSLTLA